MQANPAIKDRRSETTPAGEGKGAWMTALDLGADLLQTRAPLHGFDVYVVGFHPARDEPDMQMEAHHYCKVVNDDFLQCALFDGNTKDANLIGIEYIVSERLFATFDAQERTSWHPHNFEVLSGQLVAPGLPEAAEKSLMKRLVNSYGKTWHLWHTSGEGATRLPVGDPKLMWSFNREGEADERMKQDRNEAMHIDTEAKRADRQSFVDLAHPQEGVDLLKDHFPGSTPMPGVVDVRDAG